MESATRDTGHMPFTMLQIHIKFQVYVTYFSTIKQMNEKQICKGTIEAFCNKFKIDEVSFETVSNQK